MRKPKPKARPKAKTVIKPKKRLKVNRPVRRKKIQSRTKAMRDQIAADCRTAKEPDRSDRTIEEGMSTVTLTPAPRPAPKMAPGPTATGMAARLRETAPESSVDNSPHLIIVARAGTGKTTTLVEGLKRIKGIESTLVPSPQQEAVWEAMELSKGKARSLCMVAFNKSIAVELQSRVPEGVDAMTMHSMGLKAVTKAFGRVDVNGGRVADIISELTGRDIRELRRFKLVMLQATEKLVGLCKQNLVDPSAFFGRGGSGRDAQTALDEALSNLASHYEVELNGSQREVFDLVPRVLERCKDVSRDKQIDYNDMIWLPVALNLPVYQYDVLLVDEAQDLNRCQQALAKKAGKRLILCGDPKQAIYGFAGADAESMNRMSRELDTGRGCMGLPLTVTRRCGRAIVAEANKIVPDFEAHESNSDGTVWNCRFEGGEINPARPQGQAGYNYQAYVKDGDMILCRCNAPLVSQCFRFLKAGRKAQIQGRDVGQGLISTVNKLTKGEDNASSLGIPILIEKLSDWLHSETRKEQAKRNANENRLIALQDRYDCLMCFTEGAATIQDVTRKIEQIFTDDRTSPGIKLSSVHKAKGLESKRVFILTPTGASMPHPMAKSPWQKDQEMNIKYVAITRAIEELVWVT